MTTMRQIFAINDTGRAGDTGPSTWGVLSHMRWNPDAADTGADLEIAILPKAGDSGDGWVVFSKANCLGANFVRGFGQMAYDATGKADTGLVPIILAGDRLRVKTTNQASVTTALQGRLYVYLRD